MRWLAVCLLVAGCGRIRYEDRACPQGTTEIHGLDGGPSFCIDTAQAPTSLTYLDTVDHCAASQMRICSDAEWLSACTSGAPLSGMTDDWEWVAELYDENNAWKRGGGGCEQQSTHEIHVDLYGVRCCRDR